MNIFNPTQFPCSKSYFTPATQPLELQNLAAGRSTFPAAAKDRADKPQPSSVHPCSILLQPLTEYKLNGAFRLYFVLLHHLTLPLSLYIKLEAATRNLDNILHSALDSRSSTRTIFHSTLDSRSSTRTILHSALDSGAPFDFSPSFYKFYTAHNQIFALDYQNIYRNVIRQRLQVKERVSTSNGQGPSWAELGPNLSFVVNSSSLIYNNSAEFSQAGEYSKSSTNEPSNAGNTGNEEPNGKSSWKVSVAGMSAGFLSSIATCPLDVVKTRMQYQAVIKNKGMVPYTGTLDTFRRIVHEESFFALYRGLKPMLLGYLPTWAIYFTTYEWMKSFFSRTQVLNSEAGGLILSALVAGASTATATNPIWVLKSRFMTQNDYTDYKYSNIRDALKTIFRDEGIKGFYKGLGISLVGVFHVAVQFPLYEKLKTVDLTRLVVSTPTRKEGHIEDSDGRVRSNQEECSTRKSNLVNVALASAASKMIASSITYPHEVIRTRLQNQVKPPFKYSGIVDAAIQIWRDEGFRGFYSGISANLIRTVPSSMITLLAFEAVLKLL
ncbi:hypothetical protein BB561_005503 [Smittium simulii]|uniref:Mitochondrial carrier n=1 Tax=Smittium simulii TaxID=133385 RepID=A0A2T9YA21_9FUNG|nr:hypothetical protein BB561_005503 [Smittium simulii]